MEEKIIIAGFGGQGVVLAGNVLAQTALIEGKNVTAMVSYGVEMRGGTANCTVVISDSDIYSPVVDVPSSVIILNQPSFDRFESKIKSNGLAVINKSLIEREPKRSDIKVLSIPATEIANKMGNTKVANMVLVGAFVKETKIVNLATILDNLHKFFSKSKQDLIAINKEALKKGANFFE